MILRSLLLVISTWTPLCAAEPLPSWRDGPTRTAILDFVETVTTEGGQGFVEAGNRIAVFDNDGTLRSEQPVYSPFFFALDRPAALAADDPNWASTPTLQAAAAGNVAAIVDGGHEALLEVVSATHAGMTVDAFTRTVARWIAEARHPETGRLYTEMVYQPMLELLDHLRSHEFATCIVSRGGVDFMSALTEEAYGIPPEQVLGSLGEAQFEIIDGEPVIVEDPGVAFVDDKGGKPVAIARHIGRQPIFVAGNSDGDLAIAQWSTAGTGPRFALFVHHTDAECEWAYDRATQVGRLDAALDEA